MNSEPEFNSANSKDLPKHLSKYVVDQNYDRYTPIDQSVWRYILRQLVSFLSENAHEVYREGLEKTGISIEKIPSIADISDKIEPLGWKAIPVSGFIPPAAFMEFQSLGYLPIASDMRTVEHTMYTPAPDIVHEAAGHAPIIADTEYANYLKKYAQVAKKAIISHEDIHLYEAIRDLSDIKEDPDSTEEEIKACDKKLNEAIAKISFVSEAAQLGRMNWWTAEYGLVGDISSPKIFGAGLLSSSSESKDCLSDNVKKIPLTLDCINYNYDITEPQPQLFVARDFSHLSDVLDELAEGMSFSKGGVYGLEKIKQAQTVNTVELSSGLQISGLLANFILDKNQAPAYLQFDGPTQLCHAECELDGHSRNFHSSGYGTAVGQIVGFKTPIEDMSDEELSKSGINLNEICDLTYESGVHVTGRLKKILRKNDKVILLTFAECKVVLEDQVLFDPEWGIYDLGVGVSIPTVFGSPADREAYGETVDFVAKVIPSKEYDASTLALHEVYSEIRSLRERIKEGRNIDEAFFSQLLKKLESFPNDWLATLEIYEVLCHTGKHKKLEEEALQKLKGMAEFQPDFETQINEGLSLVNQLPLVH